MSEAVFIWLMWKRLSHERNSTPTILINPNEASSILDQDLSNIERQLMLIKRDLEILQLKIVAGDVGTKTHVNKTIGRINHWVRLAT